MAQLVRQYFVKQCFPALERSTVWDQLRTKILYQIIIMMNMNDKYQFTHHHYTWSGWIRSSILLIHLAI